MNKAITDGVVFQPPAFAQGLDVWSAGDGTPGSDTYDQAGNAAFIPADQDFGGALEIAKTASTTRLRYMGETPILPGCYLRVTARVKCLSGNFPNVRIAAWAGKAGGQAVTGIPLTAPSVALDTYGEVVTVQAILGTGARQGVDMPWGLEPLYAHVGLDLTGPNGSIVRIDDLVVEDISSVFLADVVGIVDVRDYGAIGDGVADDAAAFEAADAFADGREILVPAGTYRLADDVTLENPVRFVGTVAMDVAHRLVLQQNFELPSYIDAFGDEETGFKKAFQALMDFNDHDSLDMGGRRVSITAPMDMAAAAGKTAFATRRVLRNGQFQASEGSAWDSDVVTSVATYDPNRKYELSGVTNAAAIQVGSLIEGVGVGREVYVQDVDVAGRKITMSQPFYGGAGTQQLTFTRFKYMFDFSGFGDLSNFAFESVEFQCKGHASGIMMATDGLIFHLKDCAMTKPADRGITSIGTACQGLMIDRCNWTSNEIQLRVQDRKTIGFNTNSNDIKIRDNRIVRFKHFGVIGGTGSTITGNHWFHGDTEPDGVRRGGLVFTTTNVKSLITGNYIDNNFIEWTNEYEEEPEFANQFAFGGMTITGNVFTVADVAPWFSFIVIKPYGSGHYIQGLSVIGNVFRSLSGKITRVDKVDTTFADLDHARHRNITWEANSYNGIDDGVFNPVRINFEKQSESANWNVSLAPRLPFGSFAKWVECITPLGRITNTANQSHFGAPYAQVRQGADQDEVKLTWSEPVKGEVMLVARMDQP
ncbi:MAG: glycosyl hydrolase family 28-related protein [Shimia sp.]